jgi:UDP-N-acetylglucosamine--N-acetylmuramyl-(pentapeptide) pyrophosphoryl-undecaprenol N-acetylglucosamine transferase
MNSAAMASQKVQPLQYGQLRVVMAGGGTGGHLFPGVAIAEAFLEKNAGSDILFVSTGNAFEKKNLAHHGFRLACIAAEGLKGRGLWRQLKALFRLPVGVWQSWKILRRFAPTVVIGVGGYASGPLILAAWLRGVPVALHEQNMLPGITNRMVFPLADRVYVSFPDTRFRRNSPKIRCLGNPVRRQFLDVARSTESDASSQASGSDIHRFTVAVVGGSQGALAINRTIADMLAMLHDRSRFHFIHHTGDRDIQMVQDAYCRNGISGVVQPFFENMAECYRDADLLICRSGAATIAEITVAGKPAILIPFPYAADNHQALNAMELVQARAAEMILEADLTPRFLMERLQYLASQPASLRLMAENARSLGKPFAAENIVEDCYTFIHPKNHSES